MFLFVDLNVKNLNIVKSKYCKKNYSTTIQILCILAALSPRFLAPQRRHSSVSLGNLTSSQNDSLRPSPLRGHENETDMSGDNNGNTVVNCDNSSNYSGNRSKLVFGNVTSIPIVLCGMLQSDIFSSNFNMGRPSPSSVCGENSPSVSQHYEHKQQRQQEQRSRRRAFFDPQQFGDNNESNHDNLTDHLEEGSA